MSAIGVVSPSGRSGRYDRQLALIEWLNDPPKQTFADGSGVAEIRWPIVSQSQQWGLERVTVMCVPGTSSPQFRMYVGEPKDYNVVEGTVLGNFDVAEYSVPGMLIPSGQFLTGRWTGCPVGAACYMRLQYGIYEVRYGV